MVEKTKPGVAIDRFRELARKYKMDIVPGSLTERDPTDGHVYNTTYYIDQSGEVLLSYRKVHLWHPERTYIKMGQDGYSTVKNRFGIEVGLAICWDIAFPNVFKEMALNRKAQLIIAPGKYRLQ
jgi:predicted amidohydrolase